MWFQCLQVLLAAVALGSLWCAVRQEQLLCDAQEQFVTDFVAAWNKVTNADLFDQVVRAQ